LKNLFDFIDTDKNGKINYTEFIASTVTDHVMSSKKNLENVFNMLDKDGNGYVDRDEIMGILSQHGHISN
jgi:calcium-dependent protein kinase